MRIWCHCAPIWSVISYKCQTSISPESSHPSGLLTNGELLLFPHSNTHTHILRHTDKVRSLIKRRFVQMKLDLSMIKWRPWEMSVFVWWERTRGITFDWAVRQSSGCSKNKKKNKNQTVWWGERERENQSRRCCGMHWLCFFSLAPLPHWTCFDFVSNFQSNKWRFTGHHRLKKKKRNSSQSM